MPTHECIHDRRIQYTEDGISNIKDDIHEIRGKFDALESTVSGQLGILNKQIGELSTSVNGLVLIIGERDKMSQVMLQENKSTFERFGNKIDSLESRLRNSELHLSRADIGDIEKRVRELEKSSSGSEAKDKILWAGIAGAGGFIVWVIENYIKT